MQVSSEGGLPNSKQVSKTGFQLLIELIYAQNLTHPKKVHLLGIPERNGDREYEQSRLTM